MQLIRRVVSVCLGGVVVASLTVATAGTAAADPETVKDRVTVSDGTSIALTVTGQQPIQPRPTVVEFTPYGSGGGSYNIGADYNYLVVQIRGTGDSNGSFDALGPRSQQDVVEVLDWACRQPWSNGDLAVAGFSASAIMIFNSLHQELPCVKAAVLRSGTFELYRDLLIPGGIPSTAAGLAVLAMIGAPALAQGPERLARDPLSTLAVIFGLADTGFNAGLLHPTLDTWWQQRGFRGNANRIPTLFLDGVFDVEPRGDYQGFQELRAAGIPTQLQVTGAHDGAPRGTDLGAAAIDKWLDRYLRGVDNGVEDEPAVQMLLADGDREAMLGGEYVEFDAADWPAPGTRWESLFLAPGGGLSLDRPAKVTPKGYLEVPSLTTQTDPNVTATIGGGPDGPLNQLATYIPALTDMNLTNATGAVFTTPKLSRDVTAVGPGTLELKLRTLLPTATIWAVVSDVDPAGKVHPMTVGRLNTAFPDIVESKSLYRDGKLVQPYGDYSKATPPGVGATRRYHVELWPVANRFKQGHRIQVTLVGRPVTMFPTLPSLNTIYMGGAEASSLTFPVAPGSDLAAALR